MEVSEVHTKLGEAFGFVCWMWIFHRARNDLPVVLGWRHPWEHAEDPWAGVMPTEDNIEGIEELKADWEKFTVRALNPEDDVSITLRCLFSCLFVSSTTGSKLTILIFRTMMMMMTMKTKKMTRRRKMTSK